jgi:hypothetical protein
VDRYVAPVDRNGIRYDLNSTYALGNRRFLQRDRGYTISKKLGYRLSPQTLLTKAPVGKGGFSGSVCSAS